VNPFVIGNCEYCPETNLAFLTNDHNQLSLFQRDHQGDSKLKSLPKLSMTMDLS